VKVKTVSFEKLLRDKRRARLRDERRLARGEVTPEQLQEENSLFPLGAKITIPDFCQTLERCYGKLSLSGKELLGNREPREIPLRQIC
jgi:hypothetical protein